MLGAKTLRSYGQTGNVFRRKSRSSKPRKYPGVSKNNAMKHAQEIYRARLMNGGSKSHGAWKQALQEGWAAAAAMAYV